MKYAQFIAKPNKKFSFKDFDPDFTGEFETEEEAGNSLQKDAEALKKYQDILMKHETKGLLVIFQGMDTAGKDPLIKHIMSNVDPQGVETKQFKSPTEKERRHDYLWRVVQALPARGQIGIFNRSYYEHVAADRVHPEKLDKWTLPDEAKKGKIWERLYREINNFEEYLTNNGIYILKFFLHMSKDKQRDRLLERISRKDKRTGFSWDDIEDRGHWDEFMKYYEEAINKTSTKHAPWYIIPDDNRWFAKAAVASIIVEKLKSMHKDYPQPSEEEMKQLKKAERILKNEK